MNLGQGFLVNYVDQETNSLVSFQKKYETNSLIAIGDIIVVGLYD